MATKCNKFNAETEVLSHAQPFARRCHPTERPSKPIPSPEDPMNAARQTVIRRLKSAPWKSRTTEEALTLIQQSPSERALSAALGDPRQAPAVLEALCAWRSPSERVYEAVVRAIDGHPSLCWSLIESLNRLPWHNGMRAFLTLPDLPTVSPCAYPFYILARNKVFDPPDMSGFMYDYHFHGLWAILPTAKSGDWHHAHPSAFAIVELLHNHLNRSKPDRFVIYFSALMLGGIGPLRSSIRGLKRRLHEPCASRVRDTAALTLAYLDRGHDSGAPSPMGSVVDLPPVVQHAMV